MRPARRPATCAASRPPDRRPPGVVLLVEHVLDGEESGQSARDGAAHLSVPHAVRAQQELVEVIVELLAAEADLRRVVTMRGSAQVRPTPPCTSGTCGTWLPSTAGVATEPRKWLDVNTICPFTLSVGVKPRVGLELDARWRESCRSSDAARVICAGVLLSVMLAMAPSRSLKNAVTRVDTRVPTPARRPRRRSASPVRAAGWGWSRRCRRGTRDAAR